MASVIGLAPIWLPKPCESGAQGGRSLREEQWPDLKGRLRELLCIHARTKMVPEVGIAPTSPRLQRGANLPQLLGGWLAEPKLGERRLACPP